MRKLKGLVVAGSVALALGTGSVVQAAPTLSVLYPGYQLLSDNSAEFLINEEGSTGATTLDLGDRLRGIFSINTTESLIGLGGERNIGGLSGVDELTGLFDITVVAKSCSIITGACSFAFGPTSSFEAIHGTGAMVAVWTDAANNYTRVEVGAIDTIAEMEANATDGTKVLVGALTDADTFWVASTISDDIAVIAAIPPPANGGTFNFALDFIFNAPGWDFLLVPCTNPVTGLVSVSTCGSGSVLGTGGATTPFEIFDNVDLTVNKVPEPASLGLLGLALAWLGFRSRRRI